MDTLIETQRIYFCHFDNELAGPKFVFYGASTVSCKLFCGSGAALYIVMCQRGGFFNEPPWLQAATRHGASDPLVHLPTGDHHTLNLFY